MLSFLILLANCIFHSLPSSCYLHIVPTSPIPYPLHGESTSSSTLLWGRTTALPNISRLGEVSLQRKCMPKSQNKQYGKYWFHSQWSHSLLQLSLLSPLSFWTRVCTSHVPVPVEVINCRNEFQCSHHIWIADGPDYWESNHFLWGCFFPYVFHSSLWWDWVFSPGVNDLRLGLLQSAILCLTGDYDEKGLRGTSDILMDIRDYGSNGADHMGGLL